MTHEPFKEPTDQEVEEHPITKAIIAAIERYGKYTIPAHWDNDTDLSNIDLRLAELGIDRKGNKIN
jgi:hypothetical protein